MILALAAVTKARYLANGLTEYPVKSFLLPENLSIVDIFARFSASPWSILLDSAQSPHENGRYDILLAEPIAHIQTFAGVSHIWHQDKDEIEYSHADPLSLIEKLNQALFPELALTSVSEDIPFACGAAGYFSYDLGRCFENLPQQADKDIQAPDMAVGFYSWALVKDNHSGQSKVYYHPHYPAPSADKLLKKAKPAAPQQAFKLTGPWQANMSKQQYLHKLGQIHQYLLAGDCYQVNLAQRFSATYQGDEYQAYLKLRATNQAPFSAFLRLPQGAVLSLSPERFLLVDGDKVQTKPIKGTRPRGDNPQQDAALAEELRAADKDRAENLMIVDLLRNDLSKHCLPGSVQVPKLFDIESFPAVHHLVSTVEGQLKPNASALDLLRGAFPGGSITGAPKIRAMQIIEELEPQRRHLYCGSIGYLSAQGRMDTSICIRTLICENQQIHCWAGGGIVLDSDPQDEYQETLHKVNKILPVLT
ncbi:aminodeoxychorismate synthase component I [Bowmanella denitrificans]|uniref:aminodeoxychorismate synthase component I n=1 Tax=Bowmanella denitrificans TaxID=366582 RepID=UPI0031E4321F